MSATTPLGHQKKGYASHLDCQDVVGCHWLTQVKATRHYSFSLVAEDLEGIPAISNSSEPTNGSMHAGRVRKMWHISDFYCPKNVVYFGHGELGENSD